MNFKEFWNKRSLKGKGCIGCLGVLFFLFIFGSFSANNTSNIKYEDPNTVQTQKIDTAVAVSTPKDQALTEVESVQETQTDVAGASVTMFKAVSVIDGDTIELENGQRVRYIGMDTPEITNTNECFGLEATNKNIELVEGKNVRMVKDVSETDRYGRLLRYVYVDDIFVNDYLVRQGYANASSYPPDVKYQEQFLEAEREARNNNRGLWSLCNKPTSTSTPAPNVTLQQSAPQTQQNCNIKGNISSSDEKIYHVPGCASYEKTQINLSKGEKWFCSEQEAINAGWRKAKNCN